MTVRGYARVAGVLLFVAGLVGVLLTAGLLRPVDDVLHLVAGGALGYAGFGRVGERGARLVVGCVGAFFTVEGMIGPVRALLDELPITAYRNGADVAHVLFGVLSLAALALPDGPEGARRRLR